MLQAFVLGAIAQASLLVSGILPFLVRIPDRVVGILAGIGAGALIGFVLAAFVPLGPARVRTAVGMALGIASVAILRCSTLFIGEAIGLLGGLLAGVAAAALAQSVLRRRPA